MIQIKGNPTHAARRFLDFMTGRHPVDHDVIFVFEEDRYIMWRGWRCNGLTSTPEKRPAKIRLAKPHEDKKFGVKTHLRALAHEYCHVLQEYRDNLTYRGVLDVKLEYAATTFAVAEYNAALEAGVIVD